jgi:hypothetical protein
MKSDIYNANLRDMTEAEICTERQRAAEQVPAGSKEFISGAAKARRREALA